MKALERRSMLLGNAMSFDDGISYTAFWDESENRVGYHVTGPGRRDTWIYFNVSDHTDGDLPNVFVYVGEANDPSIDQPDSPHHTIWPEEGTVGGATREEWVRRLTPFLKDEAIYYADALFAARESR